MTKNQIILNDSIDLNDFFNKGYAVSKINIDIADNLLKKIRNQKFNYPSVISSDEHPVYHTDTGLFYCECVTPFTVPEGENLSSPQMGMGFAEDDKPYFNDFWSNLSKENYFKPLTQHFGDFSQLSKQMMKYSKNDGLSWHYDFRDASFLINMIYLTEETFTESDGGYVEFGVCEYTGEIEKEKVIPTGKIFPNHGVMVTANNLNPNFVHRVPALKTDKKRYSLICQFGYSANVLYSLKAKNWSMI
jgi:hypothetical protein